MTPQQKDLARYADRARVRVEILARGISTAIFALDSSKDLEIILSIIDNDLEPAVKLAERTQADLEESYDRRSKTKLSSAPKPSRRKDPDEAKTKGKQK
jgi:hypothetical protein